MLSHAAVLLLALVMLAKGADLLVEHAARLARRVHVSDLIVGLIITSVGTSLPELASSLAAALQGSSGLVVGNVVGSNIANIGLVLGLAAVVRPFSTQPKMHDRDGFILLAATLVFFGLVLDNHLGRLEAAVLVVTYVAYTAFAVHSDKEGVEHRFKDFLKFVFDFEYAAPVARGLPGSRRRAVREVEPPDTRTQPREGTSPTEEKAATREETASRSGGVTREVAVVVLGLGLVVVGAHFVVREALAVARQIQIPENLIGVSLIAIGTSLPELVVSVAAARRGNAEMVVGNILGSNVTNTLLITGAAGLVRPLEVSELSVVYTVPIMLFFTLALLHFIRTDWRVGRAQGTIAVVAYVGFLVAAFVQGWG